MILKSKICGVSDSKTLSYIVNHKFPPQFVGFIINFPKSKRFISIKKVNEFLKTNKRKTLFVAVLVDPDKNILEEIKDLPFDYYQLYNCDPKKIQFIKHKYKKKIITALTIENSNDVEKFKLYKDITDISIISAIPLRFSSLSSILILPAIITSLPKFIFLISE